MTPSFLLALFAVCLTLVSADGIYTKNSPVLQVTGKTYDSLIAQSNHTSILEFYAPWCGHCQNLKPAYEKAAKNLAGLAKVAAINCDEESNKPFCGQMGVQGFPTLKIVKPGSKRGRPVIEDYQGPRNAKAIFEAVVEKIPNHVQRLQDTGLDSWLANRPNVPKAILFTEKATTSALIKSLAVDFLDGIDFAQVRSKEIGAVEKYRVTQFPTLVLLPDSEQEPVRYTEEMKRAPIVNFLSQVAKPNPDPAPKKAKASISSKQPKAAASSSSAFSKASAAHKSADYEDFLGEPIEIVLDDNTPTESPLPIVPPGETPVAMPEVVPPITMLSTPAELESACLTKKSSNCILALLPEGVGPEAILPQLATDTLAGLAELAGKHVKRHGKTFPFYAIPAENGAAKVIRQGLGLRSDADLELIALNMKRGWWRAYSTENHDIESLGEFVDSIKLGEGSKQRLPEGFFSSAGDDSKPAPHDPEPEPLAEPIGSEKPSAAAEPQPEPIIGAAHNEL